MPNNYESTDKIQNNDPRLADYLSHIQEAILNIQSDISGIDFTNFKNNQTIQRSVIFSFIIIGEASTKITQKYPEFTAKHKHVAWQAMKGMRNHLAHGYFSINSQIIWNTTQTELPKLKQQINDLLDAS